jgi:hypothetical protein
MPDASPGLFGEHWSHDLNKTGKYTEKNKKIYDLMNFK